MNCNLHWTVWRAVGVVAVALGVGGPDLVRGGDEEKTETIVAVEVGKVVKTTLRAYVIAYGTVEPAPAGAGQEAASVRITPAVSGVVTVANAVEGQRVEKGALLFQLDDRVARANLERARQAARKARQMADKWREAEKFAALALKREQALLEKDGTSRKKLEEAEQQLALAKAELEASAAEAAVAEAEAAAAETQLKLLRVEAPFAGTILRVNSRAQEAVDPQTTMAEMADLERLVVALQVHSAEAAVLKNGQSAEIFAEKNSRASAGKVCYISPTVDSKTDMVLVRLELPKSDGFRPGQFVQARIVSEERAGRLAVPRAAVYTDHEGQSTVSIVEGDVAKQIVLKAGLRDGELVEVEGEGIKEGAIVVTTGSYALPKETKIRILNQSKDGK